jgi:hypothetical protein
MAPKGRRKVILTKMDYDALCENMQLVELSQLYYTATTQLDVKGRSKLTDAEKGRKSELEESERRPFKKESRRRRW